MAAQPGNVVDPYRQYNFKLILGASEEAGYFTRCSGLGVTIEAIDYREGGGGLDVRRLPGRVSYTDVSLAYGLTSSRTLWEWLMKAASGKVERKNVSILMLEADGAVEGMRWDLINAWPSQWRGAPLDALGQEVAIEMLTIVFERIERQGAGGAG